MTKNDIMTALHDTSNDDLYYVWNDCCDAVNYSDDCVFYVDELDDLLYGRKPLELFEMIHGTEFNPNHKYCKFTIYGLQSSDDLDELIEVDELADYIFETGDALGCLKVTFLQIAEESEGDE